MDIYDLYAAGNIVHEVVSNKGVINTTIFISSHSCRFCRFKNVDNRDLTLLAKIHVVTINKEFLGDGLKDKQAVHHMRIRRIIDIDHTQSMPMISHINIVPFSSYSHYRIWQMAAAELLGVGRILEVDNYQIIIGYTEVGPKTLQANGMSLQRINIGKDTGMGRIADVAEMAVETHDVSAIIHPRGMSLKGTNNDRLLGRGNVKDQYASI